MADTALTIITDALLDLGVLADEEVPTASMAAGALRKLNNMIDSWNIESLMVYGANQYVLPFISNKGSYTIGPLGDFNIPRPALIESAFIRDMIAPAENRLDQQLYIYTDQEWQQQPFKGQITTYPFGVWFDYGFPYVTAYVNPIPNTGQYSLVIWTTGLINNLELADVISLAPGYKRALTANLCIELAASYQVEIPQTIATIARESKKWLKIQNIQVNEMELPDGLYNGYYDITSNRVY